MKKNFQLFLPGKRQFELRTFPHRFRIDLFMYVFVSMAVSFLMINGCGKDNSTSPSDQPMLEGNQAFHAGAVAGYQALGAGVSYPFKALQLASPPGSIIRNLSVANSLSRSHGFTALKRTGTISFVPALNLYEDDYIYDGNVVAMNYYSDAAGTQSAGNLTLTYPKETNYPINIALAMNITGGNLPCKGNVVISFLDETFTNTMKGTLTLTKDDVVFNLNLSLDKQIGVAGSITIMESGAKIEATNVRGKEFDNLSCDIKVSPYGWTGTGKLDLMSGEMIVNINTGTGTSTATSNSLGNLNINYADGTQEIVIHALSGDLTGGDTPASILATSGTPQSATVNTVFSSPLVATVSDQDGNPVNGVTVTFTAPSTGKSGTFMGGVTTITATTNAQGQAQVNITANATTGSYNVTASVIGVTTAASFALTNIGGSSNAVYNAPLIYSYSERTIVTINNNGQSIGYMPNSSGACYWATPNSQPQILQRYEGESLASSANGLNDNGQIVGNGNIRYLGASTNSPTNPLYWSSPTAQPQKLAVPSSITGYAVATSINNSGQIVGWGWGTTVMGIYWASPSDSTPQVLQSPPGLIRGVSIGPNGQIIATYGTNGMYAAFYSSPTAQPVDLNFLSGDSYAVPISVNAAGVIVGYSYSTSVGQRAVTWANFTAPPQALPLLPGSSGGVFAVSINNKGDIVGASQSGAPGFIWKYGQAQVHDVNTLIPSGSISGTLGNASLITDQGWILGKAGFGQYILIPK